MSVWMFNINVQYSTLQVIDNDVSKNAEFSLRLEPVSDNSNGVFYIYPETALGKTPVIIRWISLSCYKIQQHQDMTDGHSLL